MKVFIYLAALLAVCFAQDDVLPVDIALPDVEVLPLPDELPPPDVAEFELPPDMELPPSDFDIDLPDLGDLDGIGDIGDIEDMLNNLGGDLGDLDLGLGGEGDLDITGETEFVIPPDCLLAADVLFVIDSSTTIGSDDFQQMKGFVREVVSALDVAEDKTRISLLRFTSWADSRFFFNTFSDKASILQAIDDTPYYGRGTMTGNALNVAHSHHLQTFNGWRGNGVAPSVVIVITDSITQDPAVVAAHVGAVHSKATRVIAIGIGPEANVIELRSIATTAGDVVLLDSMDFLAGELDNVIGMICQVEQDVNECALAETNNCEQICSNTMTGYYCECFPGYVAVDDAKCETINECASNNGGCSHTCTDTVGSFVCSCPEGMVLADGLTCVVDSCFGGNDCAQNCHNIVDSDYYCSCNAGYMLATDGIGCEDVNECAFNNGGCAHNCLNVDGGFSCSCNNGYQLREDGASCGLVCYTCFDALSNDECQNTTVCDNNEQSCQTETRWEESVLRITKRCKQTEACVSNFVQNPRAAWSPTQCTEEGGLSVCRCCCHHGQCNTQGDCGGDVVDIQCPPAETIPVANGTALACSGVQPGDACQVVCPVGFAPLNGTTEVVCEHIAGTYTAAWNGVGEPCVDIDECAVNNGGCSHICENFAGGYQCLCPMDGNPCESQKNDLYFIVDSSSSVGPENFDSMLSFIFAAVSGAAFGPAGLQVGLMTFNKEQTGRFVFSDVANIDDFSFQIEGVGTDNVEFGGSGTRTAAAIEYAIATQLGAAQGRRAGAPLSVVVLTDGRSQDSAAIPAAAAALDAIADNVQVIGIGNVDYLELVAIANGKRQHVSQVGSFAELDSVVVKTCPEPEGDYYLSGDNKTCDLDECADGLGPCSHICVNEIEGYKCDCPDGMVIGENGNTCVENLCLTDNGGCEQQCVNVIGGIKCYCHDGFFLNATSGLCQSVNECADENGGCSHGCLDLIGSYLCSCPEGFVLDNDLHSCIPDSCFNPLFACQHTCTNIPGVYGIEGEPGYMCSCNAGYYLSVDGHNCTEINECEDNNGGCENACVNTEGGYYCECPEGFVLRADGKTCAIVCHSCINALSNEECTDTVECPYGQDSCFATMRTRDNVTLVTKGCQQTLACINNMIQNPRSMGEGPSQCNLNMKNSKCDCCCFESFCNIGSCPYPTNLPGCPAFARDNVQLRGLQAGNREVLPGGMAVLICPAGFQLAGVGLPALNCDYSYENNTATWDGSPDDLDTCVDIDECAVNNGGCIAPATCFNYPGGYECICPDDHDDYVLYDGVICERDECADLDQGGCSHNCTNTIGGYECYCPGDMSVVTDGKTCSFDECRNNNGGCAEVCINTLAGNSCGCFEPGYDTSVDGVNCVDINECAVANGGCEVNCTNLAGSYACNCNLGDRLNEDGKTCRPDPCYPNNGGCQQACLVDGEGYVCACYEGFALVNGTCVDIDECATNNGGCSHNCQNEPGSYSCFCPQNLALDLDQHTCGRACIECFGAETNEECNAQGYRVCPPDADACENEVRVHGGKKYIFKQCKQKKACYNNFIQNPREAWLPSQCNGGSENDVCRCCCDGHMCNHAERPCARKSACHITEMDVAIILDSSSSIKFNNFQIVKSFTKSLLSIFTLGQGQVHTAMMRYNNEMNIISTFAADNALDEALDAVDNTPYDGSGTLTGAAMEFAADNILTEAAGRRAGVPLVTVVFTDGKSNDDVTGGAAALAAVGGSVIAIGIGEGVDREELAAISSTNVYGASFADLEGNVLDQVIALACHDVNECETENGGCSDVCVNTGGSYYCSCSGKGMALAEDLRTCVPADTLVNINECAILNGGCSHGCEDTVVGYNCTCPAGLYLGANGLTCYDVNECLGSPCSHGCVNTVGGFFCECPPTHYLTDSGLTCAARASGGDCAAGFSPRGTSCMSVNANLLDYASASAACAAAGGRLASVSSDSAAYHVASLVGSGPAWVGLDNLAGTGFAFSDGILAINVTGAGGCGAISAGGIGAQDCTTALPSVCETVRSTGVVFFSRTWGTGAQGVLYFPTGASSATITFPAPVRSVVSWFGTVVERANSRQVTIAQNFIESISSGGQAEFVFEFAASSFADYNVSVN